MNNKIVRQAIFNIQTKKRKAEREFEEAMKVLFKDDEYKQTDNELTKLQIEKQRRLVYGIAGDLSEAITELEFKLNNIKQKYGLLNETVHYNCEKCKDEGFIDGQFCSCLKTETSKILCEQSGFNRLKSFEDFTKTAEQHVDYYNIMQKWCNQKSNKTTIFISGPTGTGKTCLISCMANELISQGIFVRLVSAFQMNEDFKKARKNGDAFVLDDYLTSEVLFIDDLGTEPKYQNITEEYLYNLLEERKRKNLSTVFTSNLTLKDLLDRYDERVFSRLADRETSITIQLEGSDKRLTRRI